MTRNVSKEKKLVRAPSDLVSKLNEVANRQGKTFYSYISEIFEQAVRAYEMGRSLKEIIDVYEVLGIHKEAGAISIPRDILDYLIQETYSKNSESLKQLWHQTGRWYGIYLREKFNDSVEAFVRLLQEGRWDLNEVSMKRNQNTVELRAISTSLSQERTLLLSKFIEGAMQSMDFKTQDQECFKGIIRLWFSPLNASKS